MKLKEIQVFILYRKPFGSKYRRKAYLYFGEDNYVKGFHILKTLHPNDDFEVYHRWVKYDSCIDLCPKK